MGTLNAVYIRTKGDAVVSAAQKLFPTAKVEPGHEFIGFILPDHAFEPPHDNLIRLSQELGTDIIWLGFQSVVDAFQFHHWHGGALLRSLVFGCYGEEERTWNQIEGQSEPWERAAFFDPKGLEVPLKFAQNDNEKHELERIWREAELLPERAEPSIDARESARKVAEFYHLPGWG